ncbi:Hypothetical_protein [Hexamita inflata]|uniref:Hypothetical_protein n=1 Tax=Hexamita inflata TaxID=28002 RepID=A0AA86US07_9EUKA|nr:Hypothetical protein HINF_LOCUS53474 [Hexamita inflata]
MIFESEYYLLALYKFYKNGHFDYVIQEYPETQYFLAQSSCSQSTVASVPKPCLSFSLNMNFQLEAYYIYIGRTSNSIQYCLSLSQLILFSLICYFFKATFCILFKNSLSVAKSSGSANLFSVSNVSQLSGSASVPLMRTSKNMQFRY